MQPQNFGKKQANCEKENDFWHRRDIDDPTKILETQKIVFILDHASNLEKKLP